MTDQKTDEVKKKKEKEEWVRGQKLYLNKKTATKKCACESEREERG